MTQELRKSKQSVGSQHLYLQYPPPRQIDVLNKSDSNAYSSSTKPYSAPRELELEFEAIPKIEVDDTIGTLNFDVNLSNDHEKEYSRPEIETNSFIKERESLHKSITEKFNNLNQSFPVKNRIQLCSLEDIQNELRYSSSKNEKSYFHNPVSITTNIIKMKENEETDKLREKSRILEEKLRKIELKSQSFSNKRELERERNNASKLLSNIYNGRRTTELPHKEENTKPNLSYSNYTGKQLGERNRNTTENIKKKRRRF